MWVSPLSAFSVFLTHPLPFLLSFSDQPSCPFSWSRFYVRPMLGISRPMLALCWPHVGFSWPSYCEAPFSPENRKKEPRPLGLSLPYVGPVLDPGWRILSRCWAHVDVFRVYMGPMLSVSGPNLAMLAVCWPYVGFSWPSYCEAPFSPEKLKRSLGLWALACPMLGPCWTHVGVSWVDVGPCCHILGLCWAHVGRIWA